MCVCVFFLSEKERPSAYVGYTMKLGLVIVYWVFVGKLSNLKNYGFQIFGHIWASIFWCARRSFRLSHHRFGTKEKKKKLSDKNTLKFFLKVHL